METETGIGTGDRNGQVTQETNGQWTLWTEIDNLQWKQKLTVEIGDRNGQLQTEMDIGDRNGQCTLVARQISI